MNETILKKNDNYIAIENRFGSFFINLEKKIFFEKGLLGLPQFQYFCLTDIPEHSNSSFKLLQSVDDSNLAFIVMPVICDENNHYQIFDHQDIEFLMSDLSISQENLVILLITNFVVNDENHEGFVNARAPIIIDSSHKIGIQYVFNNDKYEIRQKISG